MNNRQIHISIKYGTTIYKEKFFEHDALTYISFLESFNLWYEINDATDGETPNFDEEYIETDEKNEQQKIL
jgi:hypothetical protein